MTDLTKLTNMKLMMLAASARTIIITPQTSDAGRQQARELKHAVEAEVARRRNQGA